MPSRLDGQGPVMFWCPTGRPATDGAGANATEAVDYNCYLRVPNDPWGSRNGIEILAFHVITGDIEGAADLRVDLEFGPTTAGGTTLLDADVTAVAAFTLYTATLGVTGGIPDNRIVPSGNFLCIECATGLINSTVNFRSVSFQVEFIWAASRLPA